MGVENKFQAIEDVVPQELEKAGIELHHILTATHGVEAMLTHFRKALEHLGVPVGPKGVNLEDLKAAQAIQKAAQEWYDAVLLKRTK